jgi:hypothetical protein
MLIAKNFWFKIISTRGGALKLKAIGPSNGLARKMRRERAQARRRVGNGRGGFKGQQQKRRNARLKRRTRRRREVAAAKE